MAAWCPMVPKPASSAAVGISGRGKGGKTSPPCPGALNISPVMDHIPIYLDISQISYTSADVGIILFANLKHTWQGKYS